MKLNEEYKQINVNDFHVYDENYNALSGKVVDKVAFYDRGFHDENIFIITFTDKTFVAVGTHYRDIDNHVDEPQLENFYVMDPNVVNGGNYEYHVRVTKNGDIQFDPWIQILRDLGIWQMSDEEVLKIIDNNKKEKEEREYLEYLRLKGKFEKKS